MALLVRPHKRDGKSAVISADGLNGDGTFAASQNFPPTPYYNFQCPKRNFFLGLFSSFLLPEQIKKPVTYTTAPAGRPSSRWCSFWFVYVTSLSVLIRSAYSVGAPLWEYCRIPHQKAVCQLQIGGFYTILQVALEKCLFVWCSVKNSCGIHSPLDGRQAKRLPYRH